ncbi:hypothetical protein HUJ04_008141 [Dendroctonus ponderosae]|nr:hypothetical protein HUJ04_008141 [Dendroctonus ponderosae]
MCVTAIANLHQASAKEGTNKLRVTQSWHSTVTKTLIKDIHVLFVFEDKGDGQMYGLMNTELTHIKPNYEAMIKGGTLKVTEMGIQHGKSLIEFDRL